jgi:hypothetical protein
MTKEEILKEFDEKFLELWGSNDGREGYDSLETNNVKFFLSSKLDEIEKEVINLPEKLEPERPRDDYHDYIEGYNSAIQTIREKLTKYFL